MFRKLRVIAWTLAASLLLSCTTPDNPSQVSRPESVVDSIKRDKNLHAAYVVYPPFVTKDPNTGELGGYFIDLMAEIARQGQFEVTYEEAKWGTMVAGLSAGRYDIVVSGIFPTIPRSFEVTFARPIMYIGLSGVVRETDSREWTEAELSTPGLRIAVVNGEVGHEYVRRFLPKAEPIVLDTADIARAPAEVKYGRADIAIAESITCVEFAAVNPEVRAVFTDRPLQVFGSTFMVRRGDPDWVRFLDTAVEFLEASGYLHRLEERYKTHEELWRTRKLPWN